MSKARTGLKKGDICLDQAGKICKVTGCTPKMVQVDTVCETSTFTKKYIHHTKRMKSNLTKFSSPGDENYAQWNQDFVDSAAALRAKGPVAKTPEQLWHLMLWLTAFLCDRQRQNLLHGGS